MQVLIHSSEGLSGFLAEIASFMALWNPDLEDIERLGHSVNEMVDLIVNGDAVWDDLTRHISTEIPGTFTALVDKNASMSDTAFFSSFNIDPAYVKSYLEYYAPLNPWNANWATMRSGEILISERMAPSSRHKNSEFYEDWLRPQRHFDAGSGLQIFGNGARKVYIAIHHSSANHQEYDDPLSRLLSQVRGHLKRAVNLAEAFSRATTQASAEAAVLARLNRCAVVLDGNMRIKKANASASEAFRVGSFLRSRSGRLVFRNFELQRAIEKSVHALASRRSPEFDQFCINDDGCPWLLELTAIRPRNEGFGAIIPPQPLVLMLACNLAEMAKNADFSRFATYFKLTGSEFALCTSLARGLSLAKAALHLGISYETARARLKTIFDKVGVNRQVDLVLLMARMS